MIRPGRRAFVAAFAALALGSAACGGFSDADPAPAVFVEGAWTGQERLTYDLKQRDYVYGRCVLETIPGAGEGQLELRELCQGVADEQYRDDAVVVVDAETLQPISSSRTTQNTETGRVTSWSSDYTASETEVVFESITPTETHDATRDIPGPSDDVPDPVVYDDESLFWLVRGIPLLEGFAATYTNVNTSTVTVFNVDVSVEGRETVEVDAGTFDTWKIRIETSSNTNEVWVDAEAPHVVVKADIERFTYELTAID